MSANNKPSDPGDFPGTKGDAAASGATATPPTGSPAQGAASSHVDVVWTSPVHTGSGWTSALHLPESSGAGQAVAASSNAWPERHVMAFESDLFDNAVVHWKQGPPTLEMIPGYKTESQPDEDSWMAETLMSGSAALTEQTDHGISAVIPGNDLHPEGIKPFVPDTSKGTLGPAPVRKDGIEDPLHGWRPTGMVFFETLTTPPRGIVYSTTMLDAFNQKNHPGDDRARDGNLPEAGLPGELTVASSPQPKPFFDFPDEIASVPPEETEEFPLKAIVVTGGGGGGGGGTFVVRLIGKLFFFGTILTIFAFVAVFGMYSWYAKTRVYDGRSGGKTFIVTIAPGDDFRSIINSMHKDGLLGSFMGLDDRYLMRYLAYFYENSDKIKPGVHRFSSGQNLDDIYRRLVEGSNDYKLTIPEGKTAQEVAELVTGQYDSFDSTYFLELVQDPDFVKSLNVDAPSLEGYLYPSTYYFGPGMKEEELIRLMVATFHDKMSSISDKISTGSMTLHEHIIMASLIEREARVDEDRPLIASVILNRIAQNMPLQIDATVNYALNDWRRLRNSDYQVDHPYNTYKFRGLPPGPIASPRIESVLATFTAPETPYLFYVHKGDGHHAFAETYAQHQANVGRYIRERNTASAMGNAETPGGQASSAGRRQPDRDPNIVTQADEEVRGPIIIYPEGMEPPAEEDNATSDESASEADSASTGGVTVEQTPAPKSY